MGKSTRKCLPAKNVVKVASILIGIGSFGPAKALTEGEILNRIETNARLCLEKEKLLAGSYRSQISFSIKAAVENGLGESPSIAALLRDIGVACYNHVGPDRYVFVANPLGIRAQDDLTKELEYNDQMEAKIAKEALVSLYMRAIVKSCTELAKTNLQDVLMNPTCSQYFLERGIPIELTEPLLDYLNK